MWTILRIIIPGIMLGWVLGEVLNRRSYYLGVVDPRTWEIDPSKTTAKRLAICSLFIVGGLYLESIAGMIVIETGGEVMAESNYATQTMDFSITIFILAIVLLPIFEEFGFRHVLLNEIKRRSNKWVGLLGSSFFFAAAHMTNPGVFLGALPVFFVGGLFYGLTYMLYSLRWAIYVHIGANLFPYLVIGVLSIL